MSDRVDFLAPLSPQVRSIRPGLTFGSHETVSRFIGLFINAANTTLIGLMLGEKYLQWDRGWWLFKIGLSIIPCIFLSLGIGPSPLPSKLSYLYSE